MKSISVKTAEKIILKIPNPMRLSRLTLSQSLNKVLGENIYADRDQPSADRSAMDGIAISFKAWQKGFRQFKVEGVQKAGIPAKVLRKNNGCFEIMTGAVIPKGCDCIIPVEFMKAAGCYAEVENTINVSRRQFIRLKGSEYKKNALLIKKGTLINATHIVLAASAGKKELKVFLPRIAVIGTGDELVEVGRPVKPHQARRSNVYGLQALFQTHGFTHITCFHINDDPQELKIKIKKILDGHDVLVLSGGVSKGKYDFIPQVMAELGVKVKFHTVDQKPGKPFWFGVSKDSPPVFALPGNPVSTLVCAVRYTIPFLRYWAGAKMPHESILLNQDVKQNSKSTIFLPGLLIDHSRVQFVNIASSGDYGALSRSDGIVEIPPGKTSLRKGSAVKFFRW